MAAHRRVRRYARCLTPEIDCCWKCGYSLTRLTGAYVRCPECGEVNNRLTAEKERVGWRVRRWTRWLVACVAGAAAMVVGLTGVLGALVVSGAKTPWWWLTYVGGWVFASGVIGAVAWTMTPSRVRRGQGWLVVGVSGLLGLAVTLLGTEVIWQVLIWFMGKLRVV